MRRPARGGGERVAALLALLFALIACDGGTGLDRGGNRPPPPPPPPPTPAPPPPGGEVPCCSITFEGLEVTVLRAQRNWTVPDSVAPPDSVFTPAPGMEFVTLELRLENVSGIGSRPYNAAQFQLVTGDGSSWFVEPVRRLPAIRFGNVLANFPVEGWITYEVPRGAALARLDWSPRSGVTFGILLAGVPGG